MRTITVAERATVAALRNAHWIRIQIWDSTSTYLDYSTQLRNKDWVTSVSVSDNIDANAMSIAATLLRETQGISLAPFMSASVLNQVAGSYATLLDLWRKIKVSFAVMPQGYAPTGADWKDVSEGRVDTIDTANEQIQITGRSEDAVLLDKWIDAPRQYGSVAGIAMETVLQSMLDDNLGTGVVTLYTPVSPGFLMNSWTQQKGNLMQALTAVAGLAGFVLRYRYDSANTFRLTLYKPNRTASVEDWTLGPSEYNAVTLNRIDKSGIRNFIKLRFVDPTLGTQTVIYPHMAGTGTVACTAGAATFSSSQAGIIQNGANVIIAGIAYTVSAFSGTTTCTLSSQTTPPGVPTFAASAFTAHGTLSGAGATSSITRFGRVDMEIDLSYATQVTTGTNAQGMADAVGPDMEFPNLEQQFDAGPLWFVQLHDYGRFYANGINYDTDQLAGVTSLAFEASQGQIKCTLGARGKPAGRYTTWRALSAALVPTGMPAPLPRRGLVFDDGRYATQATDSSGAVIDSSVQQNLAGTPRAIAKGYQSGFVVDTGTVTFNPVYQNLPQILLRGGKAANATFPYDDFAAQSASASGFTCRAQNKNKGTITARTAEFTATLTVTTVGSTVGPATLASAPSYDNNYTARFGITVTLVGGPGQVTAVVAVESNDGVSGWIERATRSYVAGTTAGTYTYTLREVPINDSTLGLNDQIRLKLKSLTVSGPGGTTGSASLTGYDNSGGNGHGVTYSTSSGPTFQTKTPDADDYIFWEAFEVTT